MLQREAANLDRPALVEMIANSAKRGADLISQLLTFARGGDGQHQEFDVGELMDEIETIVEHTLPKHVEFVSSVQPGLPAIVGDATEISQVVMNLAINARDAMSDGGKLTIVAKEMTLTAEQSFALTTLQPGHYVSIAVSDTGTGIPAAIRDRIFDPFFTTKERGQGTGLGLSTSIGIVRTHRGAFDVQSTVGKGTEIAVILPVGNQRRDAEREDETGVNQKPTSKRTIPQ